MATIFENNLIPLAKRFPEIAQVVTDYINRINAGESGSELAVGVEDIGGKNVLFAQKGEQLFQLDSLYDSADMLDSWCDRLGGTFNSKYLSFGLGNGMFARKILSRYKAEGEIYFFAYEPSIDILISVLANFDLTDILRDERFELMIPEIETPDNNLFYKFASLIKYEEFSGLRVIDYINYDQLFPEKIKEFMDNKGTVCDSVRANRKVNERFGRKYVENTFYNAPYFMGSYSFQSLQTYLPEELPVIIVSSGPSLTESIEDIRAAKGHALIVSADSAVSVLLKHDIIPDLYMCVDPKKHAKHFEDDRVKDIPVICTIQASPASIQGHRAQVFCTDVDDVYIKAFCTLHGINLTDICSGGSVANDIFSAMMAVGLRRIILVGQDLAYTGNKSHAEGSLRASWDLDLSFNAAEVEGLNGQMVASSQEFIQYRNWFERMISQYPQMNVINATAQGARIHGAVEMPMSEALSTYCNKEYDIAGILACARQIMGTELKKEFRTYIGSSIKGFDEVDERLRSGINAYGEMLKMVLARNYQNARFQKLYEGVTTTNEILETEPCMGYAENLVQAQITEFMKDAYEQQSDEREEIRVALERGLEYFKLIRGAGTEAKDLIQSINDAVSPLYDEKIDNSSQFAMKLALDKCSGTETDYDAAQRLWEDTLRVIDPGADFTTLSAYLDLYSPGMNSIIRDHVVEGFVEDMNTRKKHLREDATSQRLVLDGIIEEISDRKDGCLRSIIEKMTGQK